MLQDFIRLCENDAMTFPDHNERLFNKPDIYDSLATLGAEELLERLNAKEWIDRFRVESGDGSVDMQGTVERVGIPLASPDEEYESDEIITKAYITGVSIDAEEPIRIHISPRNMDDQARYSLGHELGHFFLFQRGYLHDSAELKLSAEEFCDSFGRELALPAGYLEYIDSVDGKVVTEIMRMFKVSHEVVFMQLMKAGRLPKTVLVDTTLGETSNPQYSNRLTRMVVCYDCIMCVAHDANIDGAKIIDMTHDSTFFRRMSHGMCSQDNPLDMSVIEMVEREHGRL